MLTIILNTLAGFAVGSFIGILIAKHGRDGIYPEAWAWLVIFTTLCGFFVGVTKVLLAG